MTDIFREVEEDLRHEQLRSLWDKYGIYILGACLGVVLAVAGLQGWKYYQRSASEDAGARYLQAAQLVEAGKTTEAEAIFSEIAAEGPGGYAVLARFQMAANLASGGDKEAAADEYVDLANDSSLTDLMRGLANVRAAMILVDTGSREDVEARLSKLNTRDNPWRNTARELLGLAAYKGGDMATAERLYNEIVGDPAAADNIRQRAQIMLSLLAPERRPTAASESEPDATAPGEAAQQE